MNHYQHHETARPNAKSMNLQAESGFTLISVLIAAGVVMIVIYVISQIYLNVTTHKLELNLRTYANLRINEIAARAVSAPGEFPAALLDGSSVIYIACADLKGNEIENVNGQKGFVISTLKDPDVASNLCPRIAKLEFRIRTIAGPKANPQIQLMAIQLPYINIASIIVRRTIDL